MKLIPCTPSQNMTYLGDLTAIIDRSGDVEGPEGKLTGKTACKFALPSAGQPRTSPADTGPRDRATLAIRIPIQVALVPESGVAGLRTCLCCSSCSEIG